MFTRFINGTVYLGNGKYTNTIYVAGDGTICNQRQFYEADEKEDIDITGKTLIPAFRDGHAHPLFAARESQGLDVTHIKSIEELGKALVEYKENFEQLTWLDAASYDRSMNGEKTRFTLDKFVADIPVILHAEDHHTLWVNTKALEVSGLFNSQLPELTVGSIDLGEDGLPNGILREWEAMSLVLNKAPLNSLEDDVTALLKAEQSLLASGIVEIQDAWIDPGMAEVYLAADSQLKLEYRLAFRADPKTFLEDRKYFESIIDKLVGARSIFAQSIKFFVDGVFGSATALVSEPYESTKGFGEAVWTKEKLVEAINWTHERNLQTHIHAIGDAGVALALSAIEESSRGSLPSVIAHAELTTSELIAKAKELSVVMCMQPLWAQYNGMLNFCLNHLGQERLDSLYAIRDMLERGLTVAFSSDWPVSSFVPLQGIAVAVHRRSNSSQPQHNPTQAISIEEAIDAYSLSVSKMFGSPRSLDVGEPFDAVIVDGDLRQKNLEGILSTEVLAVYKSGTRLLP